MQQKLRNIRNLQTNDVCEQSEAFPLLSEGVIDRLRLYGQEEVLSSGTYLFRSGQRDTDMFIILAGTVDIIARDHKNRQVLVVRKKEREFIGELDLITSRRTLADGVVRTNCHLLRIPRARIRALLDAEGDVANIIIRAAILRRSAMVKGNVTGAVLVGCPKDPDTARLQEFLERNNYPYRFVHADDRHERRYPGLDSTTSAHLPALALPGGKVLYRPTLCSVADEIGLTESLDREEVYDLIIVGAGPAGLAAAVYGASEGLSVVVIDGKAPGGQIGTSSRIENYLGFPIGLSGQELADRALLQAHKFGARILVSRQVRSIRTETSFHRLELSDGTGVRSRAVIIASGATYSRLQVADYARFEYRGIHYAATGMEAKLCRKQETAVVGGGNSAGQAALFLSSHAGHVHLLVRGKSLQASMSQYLINRLEGTGNITVHTQTEISGLTGTTSLESVTWRDHTTGQQQSNALAAVFVMIGATPNSDWLSSSVPLDSKGFVLTGTASSRFGTAVAGIYAIGDIRSGSVKRVAAAAGEGAAVIADVHAYLSDRDRIPPVLNTPELPAALVLSSLTTHQSEFAVS